MKLGRLTKPGIDLFNDFLDRLETEQTAELPANLLSFPAYFETIDDEIDVAPHKFKSRWEAARYLSSLLFDSAIVDAENDISLWVALTVFYFDTLCPPDLNGVRKLRERAAYIPQTGNY